MNFASLTINFFVVLLVVGVVFFVVAVVTIILLLVVFGRTTGEVVVVVVERVVVEVFVVDDVDEEVVSSMSILFVDEDVSNEDGLKSVCDGLEFPVDGCNGRYPIGNWPLKFVAEFNGNIKIINQCSSGYHFILNYD